MQTIEIIDRVQALYSKGVQSDDTRLSPRHIYSKILTARAFLLGNKLKGKQKVSDWNYQTIGCVEMIEVKPMDSPCAPMVGCKMIRSKYKIPVPISDYSKDTISMVSTIDASKIFTLTSPKQMRFSKGNRFTPKEEKYFIQNGYLYISSSHHYPVIMISGLFEDPFAVEQFEQSCSNCESCCPDPLEMDFPIDLDLVEAVVKLAVEELQVFNQSLEDTSSNTADSHIQQTK